MALRNGGYEVLGQAELVDHLFVLRVRQEDHIYHFSNSRFVTEMKMDVACTTFPYIPI